MAAGTDVNEQASPQQPLPADVLIVEDNYIIALDLEDMLRGLGVARVRTANSVLHALAMIAEGPPECGLIDINLGAEKSFAVAERLRDLGIYFVFTTGYGDKYAFPEHFTDIGIVSKPYTLEAVSAAILRRGLPPPAA
ncbi:response regulator [Hyphomicrobium sp.]|uniref:response regulator n=1 Tax=Hyphomicrobium sp. TaxID=82 RepID=UPI0025C4FBE2|nr:response regulator [Hyphomicrobium sp.]MCC7252398.1 response regulator [Hyphomicrobium sp.]